MFLKIAKLALALTLLSAGCGSQSEGQSGSGKRAYYQLARAWCERDAQCLEEGGFGQTWASMDACAEYHASFLSKRFFSMGDHVECAPETDFAVDKDDLEACVAAIGEARCDSWYSSWYSSLMTRARLAELESCIELAKTLAVLEDERAGALPLGEPCTDDDACTWDAVCARTDDESCGVCASLPGAGEPCYVDPDDDNAYCALDLFCDDEGRCVTNLLPLEGEDCLSGYQCASGLDCDDSGKCAKLFEPGTVCNTDFLSSCGRWLMCNDGVCARRESTSGKLGSSCGPDERCVGGRCVDGKCEPLAALGEACPKDCEDCDSDCQNPYVCVDGTCRDVPACGTGKTDDVCSATEQCALGFGCIYSDDGPSYCLPAPSNLGHACLEDTGCIHGQCTAGRCVFAESGERCELPRECRSGECLAGRCSEGLVCE